jgi:hypothetical protein
VQNLEQERVRPQAIEWLALAVGVALTLRYRWLLDDAFVYFRYIDNLLFLKLGLVYNQGELVEGYSSPLWMMSLLAGRALRVDYWILVQALGCGLFAVFWMAQVRLNRQMSPPGPALNFPLLYLASNYAVLSYFTSGLETPLVQVMAVVYSLFIIKPSSRLLTVMVALSPLVRPELALPWILVFLWSWRWQRRFPGYLSLTTLAVVGSWMLFRIYYYADLFPNTFYLKNVVDIGQGWVYLHDTLSSYRFYIVFVVLAVGLVSLLARGRSGKDLDLAARGMMLLVAASVAGYVVKIGGDPRHFRYLAFPFVLSVCASAGLAERFLSGGLGRNKWIPAAVGMPLMLIFFWAYPPQLDRHPVTHQEKERMVNNIRDASHHRHDESRQYERWHPEVNIDLMNEFRLQQQPEFHYLGVTNRIRCLVGYRQFRYRVINVFGLTDPFLARIDVKSDWAAHKWALLPLARDIRRIYRQANPIGRGMFRRAARKPKAPRWVKQNLDTLEVIERKVFNRHDLLENLKLAFTFPGKIEPVGVADTGAVLETVPGMQD